MKPDEAAGTAQSLHQVWGWLFMRSLWLSDKRVQPCYFGRICWVIWYYFDADGNFRKITPHWTEVAVEADSGFMLQGAPAVTLQQKHTLATISPSVQLRTSSRQSVCTSPGHNGAPALTFPSLTSLCPWCECSHQHVLFPFYNAINDGRRAYGHLTVHEKWTEQPRPSSKLDFCHKIP